MTLIDSYISAHLSSSASELAERIGVTEGFVKTRRLALADKVQVGYSVSIEDEINALLNLINIRQTGWAVDMAKERIRLLHFKSNVNNL